MIYAISFGNRIKEHTWNKRCGNRIIDYPWQEAFGEDYAIGGVHTKVEKAKIMAQGAGVALMGNRKYKIKRHGGTEKKNALVLNFLTKMYFTGQIKGKGTGERYKWNLEKLKDKT